MISTIHDLDLDLLTFCRHRHFLAISEASDMVMLGGLDLGIWFVLADFQLILQGGFTYQFSQEGFVQLVRQLNEWEMGILLLQ